MSKQSLVGLTPGPVRPAVLVAEWYLILYAETNSLDNVFFESFLTVSNGFGHPGLGDLLQYRLTAATTTTICCCCWPGGSMRILKGRKNRNKQWIRRSRRKASLIRPLCSIPPGKNKNRKMIFFLPKKHYFRNFDVGSKKTGRMRKNVFKVIKWNASRKQHVALMFFEKNSNNLWGIKILRERRSPPPPPLLQPTLKVGFINWRLLNLRLKIERQGSTLKKLNIALSIWRHAGRRQFVHHIKFESEGQKLDHIRTNF